MDLQLVVQRSRKAMNFCVAYSERDALFPPMIDFSFFAASVGSRKPNVGCAVDAPQLVGESKLQGLVHCAWI